MSVMLAIGTRVHDFYEQVEKMAERYVAEVNGEVPSGADFHERLLERALPVADRAGSLFSEELGADLKELLRFRHFFRHAYPRRLEWEKLRANAERVARVLPGVERDLEALSRRISP